MDFLDINNLLDLVLRVNLLITFPLFIQTMVIFSIIILALYFQREKKESHNQYQPTISVYIPCYNEEDNISRCLHSVIDNHYPRNLLEINIIDDGSSDESIRIINKIIGNNPNTEIKLFKRKHGGKAKGFKATIPLSNSEICVLIDADTMMAQNCLTELGKSFADQDIGAVSCSILIYKPKKIIEFFQASEFCFCSFLQIAFTKVANNSLFMAGQCVAIRRKFLDKLGGIPQGILTEDYDLFMQMVTSEIKTVGSNTAIAYTLPCSSIKELVMQRIRWWHGPFDVLKTRKNEIIHNLKNEPWNKKFLLGFISHDRILTIFTGILTWPCVLYQVIHWFPKNYNIFEQFAYLFMWFSAFGCYRVVYNISEWGINWYAFFGVMCGFFYPIFIGISLIVFRHLNWKYLLTILFLFPYALLVQLCVPISLIYYRNKNRRVFVD